MSVIGTIGRKLPWIKLFSNEMKPVKLLGTGAYGAVFLYVFEDKKYAVKIFFQQDDSSQSSSDEFNSIKKIYDLISNGQCNRYLICYKAYIKLNQSDSEYNNIRNVLLSLDNKHNNPNTKNKSIYIIISDYIEGMNLAEALEKNKFNTYEKKIQLIKQGIFILKLLHSKNIAHRDIKLENLFLSNNELILIDFGFACVDKTCKGRPGSMTYYPYKLFDIIEDKLSIDFYKFQDVYSLMTVFYLLFNHDNDPFKDINKITSYVQSNSGFNDIDNFINTFFNSYIDRGVINFYKTATVDYINELASKFLKI